MLKRRRGNGGILDDPEAKLAAKKRQVAEKLHHGTITLVRAMKNAKALLLLRLQRHRKDPKLTQSEVSKSKLEIQILKDLNVENLVERHIKKTLPKNKALVDSKTLPESFNGSTKNKPSIYQASDEAGNQESSIDRDVVINNLASRLWSAKAVQESLKVFLEKLEHAAGTQNAGKRQKALQHAVVEAKTKDETTETEATLLENNGSLDLDNKIEESSNSQDNSRNPARESRDYRILPRGARLTPQIEEGYDDDTSAQKLPSRVVLIMRSGSVDSVLESEQRSVVSDLEKGPKSNIEIPLAPDQSLATFNRAKNASPLYEDDAQFDNRNLNQSNKTALLPSLLGGYWSGSEDASEIEDDADDISRPKKNRMGQQARRLLAEKKFGRGARHLKDGKGPATNRKENKIGSGKETKKKGKKEGSAAPRKFARGNSILGLESQSGARNSGENIGTASLRVAKSAARDDEGTLHPSWQAKKAAKESQKTAQFEGKKIVFD